MPTHADYRTGYARRIVAVLRASWDASPVPGIPSVLHYAASLTDGGWESVFAAAGESHLSESPETRVEILRGLAVGEIAGGAIEPGLRLVR